MKRIITKPRPLSWIFCLLLIPFGLFFSESSRYVATFSNLGLGGGIGGLIGLAWRQHRYNKLSPQQKREVERAERDERSVCIRSMAAQDSWYWTLALLWVPFVAALVEGETLWMVLCPTVIVLHCAFYMFHMYRWSKRL